MDYASEKLSQFRLYYTVGGKDDIDIQVPHLAKLGDFYLERYRTTKNWTDCVKVIIINLILLFDFHNHFACPRKTDSF